MINSSLNIYIMIIISSQETSLSHLFPLRICPRVAVKTACCLRQDYMVLKDSLIIKIVKSQYLCRYQFS